MKKLSLALLICLFCFPNCSKVSAGYVGIKVYLLGTDKGIESEELSVGRYWIGMNEELFTFPIFKQNYVWTLNNTEGSPNDESVTFQTLEGLSINADVGITYRLDPKKVHLIFQKYRKGVEEITDIFLRNRVRDAFNTIGSMFKVEEVYGVGKVKLIEQVNEKIKATLKEEGILVEKIYLIGSFRLPKKVMAALNAKIEAIQRSEQREYELREALAEAKKRVALATADAKVIRLKTLQLSPLFVKYKGIQKWNGQLPQVTSSNIPFINIK